jgi:pimeloyl-ACP methyl ester carboxylesterase
MNLSVPLVLALALSVDPALSAETERLQVDGEWCFIKTPASGERHGEAVILLHGNGETVEADSSSWERLKWATELMDALLDAGFLLAQSNHTAVPGNGMWGNPATQESVLALMDHLQRTRGTRTFHAVAMSAGNLTLLNLLLDGKTPFESAVLIAPGLSLESAYSCPAGFDRVSGIARAFDFEPAHGCPGDPEGDEAFRRATARHDPLRKATAMTPSALATALSGTRWMALYDRGDPKALPEENLLPFLSLLEAAGIEVRVRSVKEDTHTPTELVHAWRRDVAEFLKGP